MVATAAATEHALSSSRKGAVEGPSASDSIWWGTSTFDSWLIAAAAQVFLPSLSYISSTSRALILQSLDELMYTNLSCEILGTV
jgi:hypothetical protein